MLDVVGLADLYVLTTLDEVHKATVNRLTLVKPPGVPVGLPGQTLERIALTAAGPVVSVLCVGLTRGVDVELRQVLPKVADITLLSVCRPRLILIGLLSRVGIGT